MEGKQQDFCLLEELRKLDAQENLDMFLDIHSRISKRLEQLQGDIARLDLEQLPVGQRELITNMRRSTSALTSYVDTANRSLNILLDNLKLDVYPFNIVSLIDQVVGELQGKILGNGIELSILVDPKQTQFVHGDQKRVRQLLCSMLESAIECASGRILQLRVVRSENSGTEHEDPVTEFILDFMQLPGLSAPRGKHQHESASAYRMLRLLERNPIVQKLIALMDGNFSLADRQSSVDQLILRLPMPAIQRRQHATVPCFLKGKKIMLIEGVASLMHSQLAAWGGRVETFSEIQEAIEYLQVSEREDRPDLIILNTGIETENFTDNDGRDQHKQLFSACQNEPIVAIRSNPRFDLENRTIELLAPYRITLLANELAQLFGSQLPFEASSQEAVFAVSDEMPATRDSYFEEDGPESNQGKRKTMKKDSGSTAGDGFSPKGGELDVDVNVDVLHGLIRDCGTDACIDMVKIFMDESQQSSVAISRACLDKNMVLVAQESHAIKSAARTFGCDSLHDLVTQLNKHAKNNNIASCQNMANELPTEVARSRASLEEFLINITRESEHSNGNLTES